jgi:hypothetical protein
MDITSQIDLKKHVMYSPLMEKIIKEHLQKRYPESETESMWEKVQKQYVEFLKDLPYLGGKKNTHNGTGGTYDCIMIFAYYEALDHAPDMDELYDMNCEAFLTGFKSLEKIANADICDYWIVGDESEEAKKHPKKTDEKGYWYND